ncbi:DUF397 domain-containing protein [Actinocorallia sp. A-T 12471]|uniref:DUF397 domain-containing protein n=1 Tax=Actinocorallia sp. A-T 12471 TaxID=3089813 RepID=UPI0029D05C22|nr:DUF397 domain-containing protein [Actinocorallia sp. A-T 12471]MDX6742385.1 DUF397 domain-containing protein [Actinocorallia sp. A-T 12471]
MKTRTVWRKSSYSNTAANQCVEVAVFRPVIAVRDSKNPHASHLNLSHRAFARVVTGLKAQDPQV